MENNHYIPFTAFSKFSNLRLGSYYVLPKTKYGYRPFLEVISEYESGSRPAGGIQQEDFGQVISLGGEQIGENGSVDLSKIPYVSEEFYEQSEKGKVKDHDILLCKDGALTGKTCYVDITQFSGSSVMVNEHVYIFRGNLDMNQVFLFYLMRNRIFVKQIEDLAFRKKGQPGLNSDHLKVIKIPDVPKAVQDSVVDQISPLLMQIEYLKNDSSGIKDFIGNAIDSIISKAFNIKLKAFHNIEFKRSSTLNIADIVNYNSSIRMSYRWHKGMELQEHLVSTVHCCKPLGKYLCDTQNGWSPECYDFRSDYQVLGIDSITKSGKISFENVKYSDAEKNNFDDYIVKNGDFFVSRGNTTDLVALASIAEVDEDDPVTIFPDLMIRLTLSDQIDKRYLAYVINSFIGRLYFKYVTKGKNQTMVKVSPKELREFMLPVPSLDIQREIVEKIDEELEKQQKIEEQISDLRVQIDNLIEASIQ